MRILLLSDHFPPESFGGASRVAFLQAQALTRLGHQVLVLSTRQHADAPARVEVEGIHVHRLHVTYPLRWRAYLSLYNLLVVAGLERAIESFEPEIVHAHNIHTYLTYHSLTIADQWRLPVLLTAHDTMTVTYQKFESFIDSANPAQCDNLDYRVNPWYEFCKQRLRYFPLRNAIIRRVIRNRVNVIISPSAALLDVLRTNGVQARKMVVLPNGIDPTRFDTTPQEQRAFLARYDLQGRKVVLLAGRINRYKGADQILQALPLIIERVPQVVLLVLARSKGYPRQMQHFAESQGLGQYIRLAGWLGDHLLAAAYGAADVCVVPSVYFDNFPTVNLEAQAAGTPVVGTCFGGTPEAVLNGETGFIVNPFDVEALADRVARLLSDSALHARMSVRARAHVRQNFDWIQQARKLATLYQETLDTHED